MANFGKRNLESVDNMIQPRSVCLLICQSGCKSAAKLLCNKSSSYNSNWNSQHIQHVAPDGG